MTTTTSTTSARRRKTATKGEAPARRKTARSPSPVHRVQRRKPTLAVPEFATRVKALLAEFPTLYSIWDTPEIDPAFREELMVAVSRRNDAPYCNWAHRTWAEAVGASQSEISRIEDSRLGALGKRKRVAVEYVSALADSDFKHVPPKLRAEMSSLYTPREIRNIELVAAAIDLTNRSANTYEAMLSRLQGKSDGKSGIVDEMFLSAVFLAAAPPLVLLLSRYSRRSFADTTRSLVGYVQSYYDRGLRR